MKIEGFEIFTKRQGGGNISLEEKFRDMPVISVTKTYIGFTSSALQFIRAKEGSHVMYAQRDGSVYISIPDGTLSILNSYKIQKRPNGQKSLPGTNKPASTKGKLEPGYYTLSTPIYAGNMDWFKLNLIK